MARKEITIDSSFIKSASYNETKQSLRLEIGDYFYYYIGITKQKLARFRNASSRGKYYVQNIKGQYKVIRRKAK